MSDAQTQAKPTKQQAAQRIKPLAYEGAGPARLSRTPAVATRSNPIPSYWPALLQHATARINMQRSWRQSWMEHYSLLEQYIEPRRGIFINSAMPTANMMIKGMPINQSIVDPIGTLASQRCAAGMMSGMMDPAREWFKLKPALFPKEVLPKEAFEWFDETENRIYTAMARSNFYQESAQQYQDLVNFGTGPMLIYEDETDLIRCYTPCCGEYFLSSSSANRVETMARLFVMSNAAIVEMFGLENCPKSVQQQWASKGGALEVERLVAHIVEPNAAVSDRNGGDAKVPGGYEWREMYWLWGAEERPLSIAGFMESPAVIPRWSVTSNDAYGRSVGMVALPDIIQLQVMTERFAEAIEKQVRPPMLADIGMKNEPASVLPGKFTYVAGLGPDKGFRPAFEVEPDIKGMTAWMQEMQLRIQKDFFNDLFAMLEQLDEKKMTAYEVAARNQEKLQVLGPVVNRLQTEDLGPKVKRIFNILKRKGLLPPVPKSLHNVLLDIEYVGVLSLAQKAAKTASMERMMATAGQIAASGAPQIMDNINIDKWAQKYADDLSVDPEIMNTVQQVMQIRAQRQQQMQAQQTMQGMGAASQIAKNLGGVDVGGGLNAVSAMTGLGPSPQQQGGNA